ncbi:unnamed protein product (macronuclear) [Paramecium tetraurelia]|uniref:Protein kinase domain-containing protein n=1 Tax=Paramecium tetraurelia TaxID=5888 RepID=A0C2Q7_PARTE|nr:uncharacterized protein GSPATT00034552001 [Paramecium tetraurelia]CAK65074.1 unnamed protein product [Paramecium tetraurelia]|eukprot:XP_001432471.1 hypothetical protein (macronuclear) [Paramecium tetraurelia strain d4-2]
MDNNQPKEARYSRKLEQRCKISKYKINKQYKSIQLGKQYFIRMDLLSFSCVRPHTIFSKTYYLKVMEDEVIISAFNNFKNPKYIIELKLTTQILWKIGKQNLKAFGIFYQNKIKYFEAQHSYLEQFKKMIGGRVIYRNMASFYEPIQFIGEGMSAKVFRSIEKQTNKAVAVKMIKQEFGREEQALDIVRTEVKILQSLDHPNIIKVLEVYENDQTFWIVQEFVQGTPLSEILKQKLPTEQIKMIMIGLLNTVSYLQSLRIVHRDIKPENIIVQKDSSIKVIDFGFAANLKFGSVSSVCGTPGYYAPEVLRQKESSFNSDMFSVGVVLFNLITNQPMLKSKMYKAQQYVADEEAADLLKQMLEVDPVKRFTAQQALEHPYFKGFQSINEKQDNQCSSEHQILQQQMQNNQQQQYQPKKSNKSLDAKTIKSLRTTNIIDL